MLKIPAHSRTSLFRTLSCQVIPKMSLRQRIWNMFSFPSCRAQRVQYSLQYRSVLKTPLYVCTYEKAFALPNMKSLLLWHFLTLLKGNANREWKLGVGSAERTATGENRLGVTWEKLKEEQQTFHCPMTEMHNFQVSLLIPHHPWFKQLTRYLQDYGMRWVINKQGRNKWNYGGLSV